jgi:hypothetical protein
MMVAIMKSYRLALDRFAQRLGIMMMLVGCLSGLPSFAAFAQQTIAPDSISKQDSTSKQAVTSPPAQSREAWRATIARRPTPKSGCFTASYPDPEWREVPCGPPSRHPNPAKGPKPDTVGNGTDFAAQTPGVISSAVGSFNSVTGVNSVRGVVGGGTTPFPNVFMLQLNTQFFDNPPACKGIAGCQGWEQFLFSQTQCGPPGPGQLSVVTGTTACVFIEYWLLGFGSTCPGSPWISDGSNNCFFNTPSTNVPPQTIADLASLILTATTANGQDQVVLTTASGPPLALSNPSVLNLSQFWNSAEFNVFGDCCLSEAVFNRGSTIVVKTSIDDGNANAPSCVPNDGTTGETNNLVLVSPCTSSGGTSPAIEFTESFGGPPAIAGPFVDTYAEHDQQHFAYLAADGDIWDAYYCPGCSGNQWQIQKINDGGVTPTAPPAALAPFVNVYSGHDQQHFAYLATNQGGRNGEIWDAYYCPGCSGNKWQIQKINDSGVTTGPPAASAPFVDTYTEHDQQHFSYLAANGDIWDAYYCPGCSGNKWQIQKINDDGVTKGPPAVAAPFVNVYSGHDQQHFAYRDQGGNVWDAYYDAGGNSWHCQQISGPDQKNTNCPHVNLGGNNGPAAVSGPFIDTYSEHDQQHFSYLAANGDIWDVYYCPGCSGDQWQIQKINDGGVTPSAPPAASAPFVDVYSGHDQQHFAYLATNTFAVTGEIWDSYYCPGCSGNKWQSQMINDGSATSGPPAASAPFVNVYAGHDQQHFAYLATNQDGRNGEIWDAYYCPGCSGNKWQVQQIAGQ